VYWLADWHSENVICRMYQVALFQAWLVLGWLIILGRLYYLGM